MPLRVWLRGDASSAVQVIVTCETATWTRTSLCVVNRTPRRVTYTERGPAGAAWSHLAVPHSNTVRSDTLALTLHAPTMSDDGTMGSPVLPAGWTISLTEG